MARAGLTAERIVEAAADMADSTGLEKVTLAALARHFGVKDASLYSHLRNLAELRTRIALLAAEELADRIGTAVAGRAGKDAMTAFAHAYREYALEHPGRYAAGQLPLDPERAAASPGFRRGVELTYGMLRGYGLAEPDLTDAGRLLRSAFHGYVTLQSGDGFDHPRRVDASFDRALEALHVALENWPRTAPGGAPGDTPGDSAPEEGAPAGGAARDKVAGDAAAGAEAARDQAPRDRAAGDEAAGAEAVRGHATMRRAAGAEAVKDETDHDDGTADDD